MDTARLSGEEEEVAPAHPRFKVNHAKMHRRQRIQTVRELIARDAYPTSLMIDIVIDRLLGKLVLGNRSNGAFADLTLQRVARHGPKRAETDAKGGCPLARIG